MILLNDEPNVSVLKSRTLMGPVLRLVTRRTTENVSRCITDVDETVLPVRKQGLADSHIGTVVVETEDMI